MKIFNNKQKTILVLSLIIFALLLQFQIFNLNSLQDNSNKYNRQENDNQFNDFQNNPVKTQELSPENVFSGIGAPWNITQFANRTDYNLPVSFSEGSYDASQGIPLYGWEGYKVEATINDLYDERNWNNGTFNFGTMNSYDTSYEKSENDTTYIKNSFQNWTFGKYDRTVEWDSYAGKSRNYINNMSGNYFSESYAPSLNHKCLELRMTGYLHTDSGTRRGYNNGDGCWWNSSIGIPRGQVIDNTIEIDVNPVHLADIDSWYIRIALNNITIKTLSTLDIKNLGANQWHHFSFAQVEWENLTNVFSGLLNDSIITIKVSLEYLANSAAILNTVTNVAYQQVLIDNVNLISKAEVKPSQIQLKMNSTYVDSLDWGKGKLTKSANTKWIGTKVYVNFSSEDISKLGEYNIDLKTTLNLFAKKEIPETVYETKEESIGVHFSVNNESNVNWESYVYVEVPDYYQETIIYLKFPDDINITKVFEPQNYSLNILSYCDNSSKGILLIPVINISGTPDAYWKFEAISSNYCEDLKIYNDESGVWEENSIFFSGDRINIRANINKTSLIQDYIQLTQVTLNIRFPNGSIWSEQTKRVNVDSNGLANFSSFQIPQSPPFYKVGEYQAIITWNNSYSTFGLNETGIMIKRFTIVHESVLIPDDSMNIEQIKSDTYFIDEIINKTILNVLVTFKDIVDETPIEEALIYINNSVDVNLRFQKKYLGLYLFEFDASKYHPGNISLLVYANHSYYSDKRIDIIINVVEETSLTVLTEDEFIYNIQQNSNISILFNYTIKDTSEGISDIDFSCDWTGPFKLTSKGIGQYNLTCNSTEYEPNIQHLLNFTVEAYGFQSQSKTITIILNEIDTVIALYLNNTLTEPDYYYKLEIWQKVEIKIIYRDIDGIPISGALVTFNGTVYSHLMPEIQSSPGFYSIILNATDLGKEIDSFKVFASKTNFKPENIQFIIGVTQRQSTLQIFINGENKTLEPIIEIPIGTYINLTAKYYDIVGVHILGAELNLSLDYKDNLIENESLNQYSKIINTRDLDTGISIIRMTASKVNYESQIEDIRITVIKIKAIIRIEDDDDTIEIKPGEDVTLTIEIINLNSGERIRGATVKYDWKLKDGEFDELSDGLYEVKLKDIPEESYTIIISALTPGNQYDIANIEVVINASSPKQSALLFQILFIIAIITASALICFIVYYQKVLKFPKPIRKVRKYRKSLKRSKTPTMDIVSREKAFSAAFTEQSGKSGVGRSTIIKESPQKDKIKKKTLNKSGEKKKDGDLEKSSKQLKIQNQHKNGINKEKLNDQSDKNTKNNNNLRKNIKLNSENEKNITTKHNTYRDRNNKRMSKSFKSKKNFAGTFKFDTFKKIFYLSVILSILIISSFIINLNNNKNSYLGNADNTNEPYAINNDLKSQDVSINGTVIDNNGIGIPWNVTHFANRTESQLQVSFTNHSYDNSKYIPLSSSWEAYKLNATIKNLYDTRNWNNGTFNFGTDNNYQAPTSSYVNDGNTIPRISNNKYQNWTFGYTNVGSTNYMSGNYIDNTDVMSNYRDCLELRISHLSSGGGSYYDNGDYCYWQSSFNIPRGSVYDSTFKIDVNPKHLANFNSWKIVVFINGRSIYSIGTYNLKLYGADMWHSLSIPQEIWTNTSNVFSSIVNNSPITVRIELLGVVTMSYTTANFENINYQQVLIDNVELITSAEAKPTDIGLKLNNTNVKDIDWGKGTIQLNGSWTNLERVYANFSSNNVIKYSEYSIELQTDLNLYARKEAPETFISTDSSTQGTKFLVKNDSNVDWEAYGFVSVPTGYKETLLKVEIPINTNISWVSSPQQPLINRFYTHCTFSNGILEIPVSAISSPSKPNGFWKIKAISPNYCGNLKVYRKNTGDWILSSAVLSGDYVNIRANITKTSLIQSYIDKTYAQLYIRFPNGSIWSEKNKIVKVDNNGLANFSSFQIPNTPGSDYVAGIYDAIVTWNNSHSIFGLNETGIIIKRFTVVHESDLRPDKDIDYIKDIFDSEKINLKVNFEDKKDNTAILNAIVYTKTFNGSTLYFSEISSGLYLLELDLKNANAGNNTLTIYGNHSYYLNNEMNITLDVTKRTLLTVKESYITIPQNQNFSILFNYTLKNAPNVGVDASEIILDWKSGNYSIIRIEQGRYNLTCNTTYYQAYKLYTLLLSTRTNRYESKSTPIRIYITGLGSSLEVFVNKTSINEQSFFEIEVNEQLNITAKYTDSVGNPLSEANVSLLDFDNLKEQPTFNQYSIMINSSQLSETNSLNILANKTNYNSQTVKFYVSVIAKPTFLEIWLNGANKTMEQSITLPITATLDIKIIYNDTDGRFADNATVNLFSGNTLLGNFVENKQLKYYHTSINTIQLGLGVKTLTLDAKKTNYEQQIENLKITIRQIKTEIKTEEGENKFEINPGEDFKMKIELKDLDFGGNVKEAEVSYSWDLEDGDLKEIDDDGVYEATLENVPEGTYEITITVFKEGGLYEFEDYKITLIVKREEQQALLFLVLFIVAVAVISGLAGYFVAYYYVLKYPKPVRKVRKYRRTLKRAKTPKSEITNREKAFNNIYKDYVTKSTHLKREKIVQEKLEPKKITKIPLKKKLIKKSTK